MSFSFFDVRQRALRRAVPLALASLFCVTAVLGTPRPADTTAPDIPFGKMKHAQRKEYMKRVVLPKMKELFQSFDEKRFAVVKCVTCHGPGAKNDTYKMPNPKLPKLPSTREGWDKFRAKNADIMKFMETKVKPTMAGLLGETPSGPGNPRGFGCGDCHTHE